ncbi:hypothetical protein predicted by Glimmer/Critica [Sorangium cellulosum So ce56]|uniref:Endonuclease/exonuclease/phosphatase domain-containing protein n=1 Tax=Sorangium cellulosum (strain So ce56) TaxID=448385 RepID=A9GTV5_SORC5|nr:hypothetical protein [Sorangium cellulosum]CAN96999.1 hypothetical protein predicted by Glimmer/Critica [Sorangium cellulosum So ce56]
MADPLTIAELLERRRARIAACHDAALNVLENRAGSLSDPSDHTTVINLPLPPTVFTVVSWNVQTFEAGKSLGTPFVNQVINRVLEALDADACILLESRADSYVNMNAIESGHVGTSDWKQIANEEDVVEDDEDDDDEPDDTTLQEALLDEQDDAPIDGGEPLTYAQNVSEMTGKRWLPPKVIAVYDPFMVPLCRDIRDLIRINTIEQKRQQAGKLPKKEQGQKDRLTKKLATKGRLTLKEQERLQRLLKMEQERTGKLTKKEEKTLASLTKRRDAKLQKDPHHYDDARIPDANRAKFASSYNFHPKILKGLCVGDGGAPSVAWRAALAEEGAAPLRDYYDLYFIQNDWSEGVVPWGQDLSGVTAMSNWRFFLRLKSCVCGEYLGAGACAQCEPRGPYTTALANLRQAVDAVTFYRCTCQESYSILLRQETEVIGSSATGQWMQGKFVSVKAAAARLLMRAPDEHDNSHGKLVIKSGPLLGFQDQSVGFYGRCPYLLPVELWLPYRDVSHKLYLVAFHAPFGADNLDGIKLRAAAMRELLEGGVGKGSKLGDEPDVMVIGDFNLDWAPSLTKPSSQQQIANELYAHLTGKGFVPLIDGGVASSLISIHGQSKWKQTNPVTSEYTSSAYDNCFLRGDDVRAHVANAAVVDVISWIEDNLGDFDLPATDPQRDTLGALPTKTQAFYIYRKYVSDHLPIVCDILVAPMTPRMKHLAESARVEANQQEERRIREQGKALIRLTNLSQHEVVFGYQELLSCDTTTETVDSYQPGGDKTGRVGAFVGTVDRHEDDHLILRCEPMRGHVAWLAWRPEARPRQIAMILKYHPPGTRMKWIVRNPKPFH